MHCVRTPVVVGLGETLLRLSVARDGARLEQADTLAVHAAGSEANVAADLARLGVPAAWVSALPETPLGARAAAELRAAGVDLGLVDWIPGARMGLFFVEHGTGARPTRVWYDRSDSAFARHARWPHGALAGASWAVASGITPALSAAARAAAGAMAAEAREVGVRLCVDVNYRARLWSADEARDGLLPLLASADLVVCSEADAGTVFDAEPDPAAFRERFAPRAAICVITRGDDEVVADWHGELLRVPAHPTAVVDRLGMGDAFLAGLLSGLVEDVPAREALARGVALAALKATVRGDQALVDAAELRDAVALLGRGSAPPTVAGVVR